jgi:hypothetical protein
MECHGKWCHRQRSLWLEEAKVSHVMVCGGWGDKGQMSHVTVPGMWEMKGQGVTCNGLW